jgi:dihydrodipicolinate synthase/N-acetylneuraminate lyase
MNTGEFHGIIPVITTAMDEDGNILEQPIRRLVDDVIEKGAHGVAGVGEGSGFHKLSVSERLRLTEITLEQVNGRVPVMIGTTANNIPEAIQFTRAARDNGADAVFIMPPYLSQLRDDQILDYYHRIAEAVDIEIVVQDNLMPSGGGLSVPLMARLVAEIPSIGYIKEENPPTGPKISQIIREFGNRVAVISGNGGKNILNDLARGVVGCMPGSVAVPGLVQVYEAYVSCDVDQAYDIFERIYRIIWFNSQHYGPATTEILRRKGIFPTNYVRPPCAPPLDEIDHQELTKLLARAGDLV